MRTRKIIVEIIYLILALNLFYEGIYKFAYLESYSYWVGCAPVLRIFKGLLRRRIVASSPECVQRGQSPRLYQFDTNLPVLAIARLVAGAIAEHILIA